MEETHHNPHDGCEACLRAEEVALRQGYFNGGYSLGVEWAVREYEALPSVKQARQDGTLAQHFTDLLGREPAKNGDTRFFKALAAALEKIEAEGPSSG